MAQVERTLIEVTVPVVVSVSVPFPEGTIQGIEFHTDRLKAAAFYAISEAVATSDIEQLFRRFYGHDHAVVGFLGVRPGSGE